MTWYIELEHRDIESEKKTMLLKIDKCRQKGMNTLAHRLTMNSSLDEIKFEYSLMKHKLEEEKQRQEMKRIANAVRIGLQGMLSHLHRTYNP